MTNAHGAIDQRERTTTTMTSDEMETLSTIDKNELREVTGGRDYEQFERLHVPLYPGNDIGGSDYNRNLEVFRNLQRAGFDQSGSPEDWSQGVNAICMNPRVPRGQGTPGNELGRLVCEWNG